MTATTLGQAFRLAAQIDPPLYTALTATPRYNITVVDYSDGGLQLVVSGWNRPGLGRVTRYTNGGTDTTITLR